ncbi:MAG TPA: tetratricopeptide repeat protein [Blastocatellia bacterium]|nr:tetratricopeptide repeat protein [Blastocatellia bacterium]
MNDIKSRIPLPPEQLFNRIKLPARRDVQESIQGVSVNLSIVQDFMPLSESLEWELSDLYWATEGLLPFTGNDVPFIINNNGRLSEDAAAILYANCAESESLGDRIDVLELGGGTGLFARYFLDAFRIICEQEGRDFYERLVYHASDHSHRTAEQWVERGLFAGHDGHVIVGTCDATKPSNFRTLDGPEIHPENLRAIFANYVLDVLPSAIVRAAPSGPEQMCIRTHISDQATLANRYPRFSLADVRALAASKAPEERARLLPILNLFDFESAFRPVAGGGLPYLNEALSFDSSIERVVLNYGAIECLEGCMRALGREGFVLVNDYGPVEREQAAGHASMQRFGSSIAVGINFPFLENHFNKNGMAVVKAEGDEARPIHTRLVCKSETPQTREAFRHRFGKAAQEHFESPSEEARRHAAAGRLNEALDSYRVALERNPRNWHLIGEVSEFVALQLKDFQAGLELIRAAIDLNPWYSTWLWNVLGDCLFCLNRFDDAHEAYLQAQRINPDDVRTNYNLAYTYLQFGSCREALEATARGLANDPLGAYRERLLNKQQEILAAISARWVGEQDRMFKRASIYT